MFTLDDFVREYIIYANNIYNLAHKYSKEWYEIEILLYLEIKETMHNNSQRNAPDPRSSVGI